MIPNNLIENSVVTDVNPDGMEGPAADAEANIFNIWRHLLDENEKIAKARLAAVQVFQDQISEDAKNLRSGKNLHAKKSLDRLNAVQKDVQQSVSEVITHRQPKFLTTLSSLITGGPDKNGLLHGGIRLD